MEDIGASQIQEQEPVSDTDRLLAALSYPVWIIALLLVLSKKKIPDFLMSHARQALVFGICKFIVIIALFLFSFGFLAIVFAPFAWFWYITFAILGIFELGIFILIIFLAIQAYNNKYFAVPFVNDLTQNFFKKTVL